MCGRYVFYQPGNFSQRFLVDEGSLDFAANYNIAPGTLAPVVTRNSPNRVRLMRWGLVPGWAKEFKVTFSTFNARLETLTASRLYKPLLQKRRCLIPANGFYEWTKSNGKTPHYIHPIDEPVFSMAGLYDIWHDAENREFYSYTIITTAANNFMKPLHHRMPVILARENESAWLDHSLTDPSKILALITPAPLLTAHPVSKAVNRTDHNSPDLIQPVS